MRPTYMKWIMLELNSNDLLWFYLARVDGSGLQDSKQGRGKSDQIANKLESHGQPTICNDTGIVADLIGINSVLRLLDKGLLHAKGTDG